MQIHRARGQNVYLLGFLLFAFSAPAQTQRLHPDIKNIGKRNLMPNVWGVFPILPEREKALGAELSKQFETTVTLLDDTLLGDYVNRLGARLVQHSDARSAIEFKIVDSEQADFTVLPAGHVFVNTGLIVAASKEAELAAALSNAIAHVAAHHSMQLLVKAQLLQIPAIPALATAWHWAKSEPQGRVELEGIKKECDIDADQLAIQYLWNTGYDPAAYIAVLEKQPIVQSKIQDRLGSAMMELQSLPDKRPYLVESAEFDAIKSHLFKRK